MSWRQIVPPTRLDPGLNPDSSYIAYIFPKIIINPIRNEYYLRRGFEQ